ncbi:hypothetical protein AAVH_21887, partial [Aphelenchoides avenae]
MEALRSFLGPSPALPGAPPATAAGGAPIGKEKATRRTRVRRNGGRPSRCEERRASEEHLRE